MAYLVRWWLASEIIGLFTLPLTFRIFRRLPDRGYTFSRIIGLLLVGYVLWIGGTAGVLPFSAGSVVAVVLVLGIVGTGLFARDRGEIADWLRASKRYVVVAEAVFLGAMLAIAFLRSYQPEIANTEKPFEYANYQAVNRSEYFAPSDPWFAGKPMPYYYLGYEIGDGVAKVTGTPSNYAFNLTLVLVGGLAALAAFGVAATAAVLLRTSGAVHETWPIVAGLFAVLLLMVIGNLEGWFELAAVHGWNPQWVYQHLDISTYGGLLPRHSSHWWPDESFYAAGWRATRLGSTWNFLEFPFFSFLLGDVHPHVLALPFKLLCAGLALAVLTATDLPHPGVWRDGLSVREQLLDRRLRLLDLRRWQWSGWLVWAAAALAAGSLIAIHTWDYPPFLLLIGAMVVARTAISKERDWIGAGACAAGLVILSLLFMLPFFASTGHGGIQGVSATEVAFRSPAVEPEGAYLPFQHLLIFWLPLMFPTAIFVAWCLAQRGWRPVREYGATMITLVSVLALAWGVTILGSHGGSGLRQELQIRGWGWLSVITLGALLAATLTALAGELFDRDDIGGRQGKLFLLSAATIAVLLVYGPELFMIKDASGTRANSTFKLWYSSWTLLSIVGGAGGLYALWQHGPARFPATAWRTAGIAVGAVILVGALAYPLYASFNRTNGFTGPQTLDGLAGLRESDPDEYNASAWLNNNVPQVVTILEAAGPSYGQPGRVSSRTGLPTVVDWGFHQEQQGIPTEEVNQRQNDVQLMYMTPDPAVAFPLVVKYGIKYVIVGKPELQQYGPQGFAKFAAMGTPVFQSPTVTIYRIGSPPLVAIAP